MSRVILKRSIGAAALTIAVGIGMLILGIVMVSHNNLCGLGFALLASIALVIIGVYMLFDRRPQVSISKSGLWVRTIGAEEIPWNAMASAELKWLPRSGNLIVITLTDRKKYTFFAEGLQVSPSDLLRMIREHIDQTNQE